MSYNVTSIENKIGSFSYLDEWILEMFVRNLTSKPCLIDFDFEIENQRSNMSIFPQVDVAVDIINLVTGKWIG